MEIEPWFLPFLVVVFWIYLCKNLAKAKHQGARKTAFLRKKVESIQNLS